MQKTISKAKKTMEAVNKAPENKKKIVGALVAGVAIGTAVGMKITPEQLEDTKNKIKNKVQSLASDLSKKVDSLSTVIGNL